jgi:galactose mutarotase-like enzyme
MLTLENETLKIIIAEKGAELQSIFHKGLDREFLWQRDPSFWPKSSPILFPIVGTLKQDTYHYAGEAYQLSRHGFARDKTFTIVANDATSLTLQLKDDASTRNVFPFAFTLEITYTLADDTLHTAYRVLNNQGTEIYFSIGGHPAFAVDVTEEKSYSDYYLLFNQKENAPRWPISPEGLIESKSIPMLDGSDRINLTRELFYKDALVFKNLESTQVDLRCTKDQHGIQFNFAEFPFLGIWAVKNADFVCIEPWCGIADSVTTNQDFTEKERINRLAPGEEFSRQWSVKIF